jgi:hypothetical protein
LKSIVFIYQSSLLGYFRNMDELGYAIATGAISKYRIVYSLFFGFFLIQRIHVGTATAEYTWSAGKDWFIICLINSITSQDIY